MAAAGVASDIEEIGVAIGKVRCHDEGAIAREVLDVQTIKRGVVAEGDLAAVHGQVGDRVVCVQRPVGTAVDTDLLDVFKAASELRAVVQGHRRRATTCSHHIARNARLVKAQVAVVAPAVATSPSSDEDATVRSVVVPMAVSRITPLPAVSVEPLSTSMIAVA
uniref:Uncharacterized protein n=1 Tax=Steinernema glaseri TaxID=37863 RepID=A0A1I7Y504_9BILA